MSTFDFVEEFTKEVREYSVDFLVRGVLGANDQVYPLGSDTKVLSTIFEIFTRPIMLGIAKRWNLRVAEALQTVYPDFTLLGGEDDKAKIAVDVKTTYRRPTIQYTLGSYTSFLRNGTKNILYPYDHYAQHWIVGFAYTRQGTESTEPCAIDGRQTLAIPYSNVEWFVQEKYKIAGDRPGSGNTANIGSIRSARLQDFKDGNGPFAAHGEAVFRDYWANFGKDITKRPYSNVAEYLEWKKRPGHRSDRS